MLLTEVNKLLEKYGKDSIEAMNKALDEMGNVPGSYGVTNLQGTMTQKVDSISAASILTVQMAHYGEYIDSGSVYTDKFPYTPAISAWCDRRGYGDGTPNKEGFNKATYPVS
jgi:hypothetical protein